MRKKSKKPSLASHKKGRSKAALKMDKSKKAKKPGLRTSKSGRKYSERRPNRSDVPGSKI